eukprot:207121-Alexandrium_andersonii.AAC.1
MPRVPMRGGRRSGGPARLHPSGDPDQGRANDHGDGHEPEGRESAWRRRANPSGETTSCPQGQ